MTEEPKDLEPVLKSDEKGFFLVLYPTLFLCGFILLIILLVFITR